METIPSEVNGVAVEFSPTVVNKVFHTLVLGLKHCIKPDVAAGHTLQRVYVSSVFDSHQLPSRHMQHKALDISRINGLKIAIGYPSDPSLKAIVDAIQTSFEGYAHKRENFGPHLKKKHGHNFSILGHGDHIHMSVN
jgi:hypothetical protein